MEKNNTKEKAQQMLFDETDSEAPQVTFTLSMNAPDLPVFFRVMESLSEQMRAQMTGQVANLIMDDMLNDALSEETSEGTSEETSTPVDTKSERFLDDRATVAYFLRLERDGFDRPFKKRPSQEDVAARYAQDADTFSEYRRLGERCASWTKVLPPSVIGGLSCLYHFVGGHSYALISDFWTGVVFNKSRCPAVCQLHAYLHRRQATEHPTSKDTLTPEVRKVIVKAFVLFSQGSRKPLDLKNLDGVTLP